MGDLQIRAVSTKKDWRAFHHFPWRVYRPGYPQWVPPLLAEQKKMFNPARGLFFRMGSLQCFLAERGGEPVGRIAAILNDRHNQIRERRDGFFGFFESVEDPEVSRGLFRVAEGWLREKQVETLYGPVSPTINDESGILLEGFEYRPALGNPYTAPYYPYLLEEAGYGKAKDMYAYLNRRDQLDWERILKVEAAAERASKFEILPLPVNQLESLADFFEEIFREAWKEHFLALPFDREEWIQLAKRYKPFLTGDLAYVARYRGRPAGLFLGLRDLNEIIHQLDGRLFPWGWWKLLRGKNRISQGRVFMMGVHPDFQKSGLPHYFWARYSRRVTRDPSFQTHDFSWVWEDNESTRSVIKRVGVTRYMVYRIYRKELSFADS